VVDEQVVLDHAAAAYLQSVARSVGDHIAADGDVGVGGAEVEVVAENVGRGAGDGNVPAVVVEDVVLDQQAVAAAGVEALAGEGAGDGVGVEDLAAAYADVGELGAGGVAGGEGEVGEEELDAAVFDQQVRHRLHESHA